MTISVAIAGLGQIGLGYDLHLDEKSFVHSHARAFRQNPAFQLVAGCDVDAGRRSILKKDYGADGYETLSDLLSAHQPDAIVVATPTQTHAELIRIALEKGRPRALLCEKPLSHKVDEASGIVEACAKAGVKLYVNYIRRADPGVNEVKRRILAGEIAAPFKGVVWYTKGIIHNGSHFLDLLSFWLGPVRATRLIMPGRSLGELDGEPDINAQFEKGVIAFLSAKEENFAHYSVELVAANGRLRYEPDGQILWQPSVAHPTVQDFRMINAKAESIPSDMDRYQLHVADQFAMAISGRESSLCTGEEGFRNLAILTAALKQA